MKKRIFRPTRRTFLKAGLTTAASLLVPGATALAGDQGYPGQPSGPEWDFIQPRSAKMDLWGRITGWTPVRATPESGAELTDQLRQETVQRLFERVEGEAPGWNPYNNLWYRVANGYAFTTTIQPMQPYRMPQELSELPHTIDEEPGFWAEIIVPETFARTEPSGTIAISDFDERIRLHYGSVHRVIDIEPDLAGYIWYKVSDDKPKVEPYYVLARHMRYIPPEDMAPIRPEVQDKSMLVTLKEQRIDCYEGNTLVYSTLMSSGAGGFPTPRGDWAVVYKQPSRHMYSGDGSAASGGDAEDDQFDLPGVPFNTFFTTMGHAIHGTWWHGDYGRVRSHGCLNVTPESARWLWRWVTPASPYDLTADGSSSEPGTPVTVI